MLSELEINGSNEFWRKIHAKVSTNGLGVFVDAGLLYVAFKDVSKMTPFVRTKTELFSDTIENVAKRYRVIINGNFYELSVEGSKDAFFGTAPKNVRSAIGGCGPIIINGLPYGRVNKYSNGVKGITNGEPSPENKPYLLQRSNLTYTSLSLMAPHKGKTIIAHNATRKLIFVLVLPDAKHNVSLDMIRGKLRSAQFNNAVFLDGSDSSLLMVDGQYLIRPASNKNETNTVGIGFEI